MAWRRLFAERSVGVGNKKRGVEGRLPTLDQQQLPNDNLRCMVVHSDTVMSGSAHLFAHMGNQPFLTHMTDRLLDCARLLSPPERHVAEGFDEAGGHLTRNTCQSPMPLPAAGGTTADQEQIRHFQVSTLAEPHCDRDNACLPSIRQCTANTHDLRWSARGHAPRFLLVQVEQKEAQWHDAKQRKRDGLPVDVLAAEFPVILRKVIDVAAAEGGVRGHQYADVAPDTDRLTAVPVAPQTGVRIRANFLAAAPRRAADG